jgi:SagB-type dehydrogenase family enzyme
MSSSTPSIDTHAGFLRPHQFAADWLIHETILDFHARSMFVAAPVTQPWLPVPGVAVTTQWCDTVLNPTPTAVTDWGPLPDTARPWPAHTSCRRFARQQLLPQSMLHNLLDGALLATPAAGCEPHRPYPSAGALFPVEPFVIVFPGGVHAVAPGIHHVMPTRRQTTLWVDDAHIADRWHWLHEPAWNMPAFAILLMIQVSRCCFKYRYRGYRHALMEAGSIYQQAATVARLAGLGNCCWSGFCDNAVQALCGLDRLDFLPVVIQAFGQAAEDHP